MRTDELFPGSGRLALGRRRDAMALEDVAHGLVTDSVSEVHQGANEPVVAPGAILPRHAHHQRLQLRVDRGTPWGPALLRAVEFPGHKLTVPGENGVRFDDGGDFLEGLLAELLADCGQCLAFAVRQRDTAGE